METVIPEVIEVSNMINYTALLDRLVANSELTVQLLQLIGTGAVFLMVVALCYFAYKFFRIFF